MIAFAVAATAEALLPHSGLFGNWQEAINFSVLVVALVLGSSLAAVVATNTKFRRNLGLRLLEPILVSLTSRSRSAGAVTGKDVDRVLDFTMDLVFDARFMRNVFPLESEDPYI
jgi:urease gamma subunit